MASFKAYLGPAVSGNPVDRCLAVLTSESTFSSVIAGSFMTSLSMPGFSITLLLLPREAEAPTAYQSKTSFDKDLFLELFDAPTDAPGWHYSAKQAPDSRIEAQKLKGSKEVNEGVKGPARE